MERITRVAGAMRLVLVTVLLLAAALFGGLRAAGSPAAAHATLTSAATTTSPTPPPMYAYYYLWWSSYHWKTTLGPNFPINQSPLPLPATLDSTGCSATSLYSGNIETDTPAAIFTQDDAAQINYDVQSAIAAGLTGFAVDWKGTGLTGQTPSSNAGNNRLDMLVHAVDQAQAAGQNFHLWLSYEASATIMTQAQITADLSYLTTQYGNDPAFDRSNGGKPAFIWVGSYKYALSVITAVSTQFRPSWYFVGGYQWNSWSASVAPYFDADSPYWSSQDPVGNPQSFSQLAGLAATLRSEGKAYFAPLAPGFNRQLNGSPTCVPRNNGATLKALYAGNAKANPQGWLLISWNEITEGTYVTPELQRYGSTYGGPNGLLHDLITGMSSSTGSTAPPPATTTTTAPPATTTTTTAPAATTTTTTVPPTTLPPTTTTTAPPSGTTPTLVQSAGATETAPSPLLTASFPVATVPGHLLVLSASAYTGTTNTITSVTDSAGGTWTKIGSYRLSGHNSDGEQWYSANAGAVTSVTAHTASASTMALSVQEFSGVATTNPLDVSIGTSNTSTSANSGSAAASAGELVIGFMAGHATTQAISVTSTGYTLQPQLTSTGDAASLLTGYRVAGASGAQSMAGSFPSAMYWAAGVVVFDSAG